MKCRHLMLLVGLGLAASLLAPSGASAQVPGLGEAGNFAILAGTAVTCTDSTVVGNVGVSPGTSVTQTRCDITGNVKKGDDAAGAYNNFLDAYGDLADSSAGGYPCTGALAATYTGATPTFEPGVWCSNAAVTFKNTTLTLTNKNNVTDPVWIFKIGAGAAGALTGTNFTVNVIGGSTCPEGVRNVYWWVDAAVTMTDSNFRGTILGGAAITLTRGTFGGDALAKTAVTLTGANLGGCKDATSPGDPPTEPHFTVDHFQCYEVKPEDKVKSHRVVLRDQFGMSTVTVRRPWLICTPTVKDPNPKKVVGTLDDLINPIDHLVCYDLSKGGHDKGDCKGDYGKGDCKGDYDKKGHYGKDRDGIDVMVDNQFGEQHLKVKEPQMLCVPSLKTVLSDDDDDGCGDPHHHHGRR